MSDGSSVPALAGLRIFISYPRGGRAHTWAERVQDALRDQAAEPWRDEASIPPGDPDWLARLEQGLQRAQTVVCIVGQETEGCHWQRREMLRADELGLPVVVCRVADVAIPLYALERQAIDLRAAGGIAALIAALQGYRPAGDRGIDATQVAASQPTQPAARANWPTCTRC